MTISTAITDIIKNLSDLQDRFGLQQTESDRFFAEWQEDLPKLTESQQTEVERIKQRYDYHRIDGLLLEGTVNIVVLAPLLALAGFIDPPFRSHSPAGAMLELEDPEQPIRGFINALVLQERLWILVVESKGTSIPVPAALPQLLAYLLASPHQDLPVYGMATNGDEFVFLKVVTGKPPQYDTSRTFSLFPRCHELGQVAQILQRLGQEVLQVR
jgi:hypothetical protein